jgi:hypothetical protein
MRNEYMAIGFFVGFIFACTIGLTIWTAPGPALIAQCERILEVKDE